jgi:hypothetical protein
MKCNFRKLNIKKDCLLKRLTLNILYNQAIKVTIVIMLQGGVQGMVQFLAGARHLSIFHSIQTSYEAQWVPESLSPSIKLLGQVLYILESNPHPNLIRTQFLAIP